MEFVANFSLNNNSIDADFDISEVQNFDALFEIYAGGVTWGNISGDIENQTDLQNELNTLSGAIDSNHQAIAEINTTMQGYGDIVTHDVSEFATSAQGAKADSALQPNDNITELNNNAGYITSAAIGDGTLTIQVNNETVGTFTANQSGNTTANIEVPDSATWGNITGDIEDQTDLTTALASKQDVLTPGTDIEITQDNAINFTNSSGYITGINSTDVTNALGYTPYNATNPDKFIVNKANGSGSVTILGTAANGTNAVNIGNGAYTAGYAVSIGNSASSNGGYSISIGSGANTYGASSVAIGRGAKTNSSSAENALALGRQAEANAKGAIQLGKGTNTTANSMAIGFADIDGNGTAASYSMLDGTTGLIPDARISSNIARSADVTTADNELQAQINNLKARGRFLALWNCATGLAETNPVSSPYTYQTGDYFIVGVVSTATPPVNYKPDGSSYTTGVASTTVETSAVDVDDVYYYDGTTWHLQINTQKTTAFVNIAGSPYDNIELAQALNSKANNSDITNLETEISTKQDALTPGTDIEIVTGGSLVPLPAGYTQVEYITTDGTAYINTGITVADTDTLDFSFTDTSSATTVMFITGRNGSDGQTMYFVSPSSSLIQWKGRPAGVTFAKNLEYNLVLKSGEVTYTNAYGTTTKTFTGGSVADTGACLIGAGWNNNNTTDSRKFIGNISKWQIIDSNSDLRFNGVPCYNSSDIYGLYDTVSNTFFPSIGANDFTGGNEVVAGTVINFTNASGYITGIDSSDVTTALGYTPYNSSNPDGYTDNVGTVTSVNNVQPDSSGNVTIPTGGTVDQTYDATSANAQSGVAIAGAGFLNNTATGTSALTINGTATAKTQAINIGTLSQATGNYGTTVGAYSYANGSKSSAFGNYARATADRAIQIGQGTNSTADTLQIGFNGTSYQLLDGTTGLIPDARISNNIARTSAIPTSTTVAGWGFITGINSTDVTNALGYTPYDSSNPSGYITGISSGDVTTALGYTPVNPSSLATVATSGSYNDLSNKPTIPAAQVNSDWNAVSGVAEILNKPNLSNFVGFNNFSYDFVNLPDFEPFTVNSTLDLSSAYRVRYGNGKYVIVGVENGVYKACYSSDGITWADGDLPNSSTYGAWKGVCYTNVGTGFLALSEKGYVSTSTDGATWETPRSTDLRATSTGGSSQTWQDVLWNGSKLIAISSEGEIETSTNDVNWTLQSEILYSASWSVSYNGTIYIALGYTTNGTYCATSSDGSTWSNAALITALGTNYQWLDLCNDGNRFIAISSLSNSGHIATSTNGIDWSEPIRNHNLVIGSGSYRLAIAYNGDADKFIVIGSSSNISFSRSANCIFAVYPRVTRLASGSVTIYIREWADGTLEQWCYRYTQSSAGAYTITYPIQFYIEPTLLTTYTLASSATTSTTTRNYGYETNSAGFKVYLAANGRLAWYAKGRSR